MNKNVLLIALMAMIGINLGLVYALYGNSTAQDFNTETKVVRALDKTFVEVSNLDDAFKVALDAESEFAVYNDQTWIPVPGKPVEVIIINDESCQNCDPAQALASFRQNITPALLVRTVNHDSEEGKTLVDMFDINAVPSFVFTDSLKAVAATQGEGNIADQFVAGAILVEKEGKYVVNNPSIGVKPGAFLREILFADLKLEPSEGQGKVKVVEFTDLQCPYCKRLYDQNKDLIDELVAAGKIQYVMKDFPLSFHKEARTMHAALNCSQDLGGMDAYNQYKAKIFANQRTFSGKGDGVKPILESYASELNLNADKFTACMNSPEKQEEITADMQEGQKYGVTGTPALFIGKKLITGAVGPDTVRKAVEEQL